MGFIIVILASILFGSFPSIQKNVLASGVTPITLVIICNGIASITALIICKIQRKSIRIRKKQVLSLLLIGIVGLFFTDFLLDIAYTLIPVGYVTMIHFMYPALVCILMSLLFHEKITGWKITAILLSVAGLALLTGGGFSGSMAGILVAAATAGFYSFYMIATEKTPASEVDPMVRVFYTNLFVIIPALICAGKMKVVLPDSPAIWGQSAIIGIMLCLATFLINMGVAKIGAGKASFINMVEPITSLVVSALIYQYGISPLNLAGCILILGSLLFAAKSGN